MIVEIGPEHQWVQNAVEALMADDMVSSVQLTVGRARDGHYTVQLSRTTTLPARVQGLHLGCVTDVPVGNRRATWILTDAVHHALTDPEAHMLLHW